MLRWELRERLKNFLLKTLEYGAYEKDAECMDRESNLTPHFLFLLIVSNTIIVTIILKIITKLVIYVVYAVVVICMISLWKCLVYALLT
jgi:hypothetical protein